MAEAAGRRVLVVPVDCHDGTLDACRWAAANLFRPGDEVHLVHVLPRAEGRSLIAPNDLIAATNISSDRLDAAVVGAEKFISEKLLQVLNNLDRDPVVHMIKAQVDSDSIGSVICRKAEALGAAAIIMNSSKKSKASDLPPTAPPPLWLPLRPHNAPSGGLGPHLPGTKHPQFPENPQSPLLQQFNCTAKTCQPFARPSFPSSIASHKCASGSSTPTRTQLTPVPLPTPHPDGRVLCRLRMQLLYAPLKGTRHRPQELRPRGAQGEGTTGAANQRAGEVAFACRPGATRPGAIPLGSA